MPYISQGRRENLDNYIKELNSELCRNGWNKGDLNYCITKLIVGYIKDMKKSYQSLSDIVGVLSDVKTEFERRIIAPYENKKISENGDVYEEII